jgi:hypothetical protein
MCPVCFSSVAWLITGGVSVLGATAGSSNRSRHEHCHKNTEDQRSAEGITLDEGACRGCDQRIHRNAATLVTLAIRSLICT